MPDTNTIEFFGEVDEFGFFGGMNAEVVSSQLSQMDGEDLEIIMNSPGGDVFEGMTIANLIARRKGNTTITVVGLAASIAANIAMSADVLQMADNSMLMIHDSGSGLFGNAAELRKRADLLDQIDGIQANIFVNRIERSGKLISGDKEKTRKKVEKMLDAETWLTATEALELGLIDKIVTARKPSEEERQRHMQANHSSDKQNLNGKVYARLTAYRNTPKEILNRYKVCENCNNKPKAGTSLARILNERIDEMAESGDSSRADIIKEMSSDAGISTSAVSKILNAEIDCPPFNRIEAFARVLDISIERLITAGRADGCAYGETDNETAKKMDAKQKKGFFAWFAEQLGIKATIEEEKPEEVKEPEADNKDHKPTQNEEMTNEEMLAKLKEAGYTIEEPKTEEVEPQKEEKSEPMELAAMRKKMEEMEASLKDMKLKAATMPSGASDQPQAKKEDKNKINLSADNKKSFENLAALVREL